MIPSPRKMRSRKNPTIRRRPPRKRPPRLRPQPRLRFRLRPPSLLPSIRRPKRESLEKESFPVSPGRKRNRLPPIPKSRPARVLSTGWLRSIFSEPDHRKKSTVRPPFPANRSHLPRFRKYFNRKNSKKSSSKPKTKVCVRPRKPRLRSRLRPLRATLGRSLPPSWAFRSKRGKTWSRPRRSPLRPPDPNRSNSRVRSGSDRNANARNNRARNSNDPNGSARNNRVRNGRRSNRRRKCRTSSRSFRFGNFAPKRRKSPPSPSAAIPRPSRIPPLPGVGRRNPDRRATLAEAVGIIPPNGASRGIRIRPAPGSGNEAGRTIPGRHGPVANGDIDSRFRSRPRIPVLRNDPKTEVAAESSAARSWK